MADHVSSARRQKIGPAALTIILHLIVVALLFFWKGAPIPRKIQESLTTVFLPKAKEDGDDEAKTKQKEKKQESASAAPQPTPSPPIEPPKTPEPPPIPLGPSWLTMSRAEFAASDISKMARAQKNDGDSDSGDSSATGGGDGPGGVRLYNADWYRKPTNAELNGYLPARAPRTGWGLIACRTIERFHVDNCQTIGEAPLGSGFGRAVRDAAWQFLVMPPRINGKPQVGAWVRIRITYGESEGPD